MPYINILTYLLTYLLLVLWITSCFPLMDAMRRDAALALCCVLYGLTLLLHCIGCILSQMAAGAKARGVLHARAAGARVHDALLHRCEVPSLL